MSASPVLRIHRLSVAVRWLAAIGALVLLVLPPVFWSQPEWVASVARREWALSPLQLDAGSRLAALAASLLQCLPGLWAMWEIWRLFGRFAAGEVLAPRPARHLRRLGGALITLAVLSPLSDTLTALALTWHNPPGQRQLIVHVSGQDYLALLFGLMLMALAAVLGEAARVAQEHSEFV